MVHCASEMGEDLFTSPVASITVNKFKLTLNSFGPCSIHIRLCDTNRNNNFNGGGMCYSHFNIWGDDQTQIWPLWMTQKEFRNSDCRF